MTPTTPLDPTTPVTPLRVSAPGSDRVHIADRVNAAGHPLVLCGRLRPSSAHADHREVTCASCLRRQDAARAAAVAPAGVPYLPWSVTYGSATRQVPTTDLAEGDIVGHHGMVLRLERRHTFAGHDGRTGIYFDGVVCNLPEITDAWIRGMVAGTNGEGTPDRPVWRVQGNELARWYRVGCGYSLACEAHATEVIDCGPLGAVPACADCAALYARLGGGS